MSFKYNPFLKNFDYYQPITGLLDYKGTWDASTAVYPSSPAKGDYYVASVAGTISGVYYAIGDWMVYNGTSWDKVDNTVYLTKALADTYYYPLSANPAGYYKSGDSPTFAQIIDSGLTGSAGVVFSTAGKQLTSTGIGTSVQFIKGDGSLDSNSYYYSGNLQPLTLTSTYVGYGSAGNVLTGSANLIWDNANRRMGVGFIIGSPTQLLDLAYGHMQFTGVTKPTALTATLLNVAGNVTYEDHYYQVTFITALGETMFSPSSNMVTTDATHSKVQLSNIPVSTNPLVIGRKIYRTKPASGNYYSYLLTTINDNTTTTYLDNTADASLGATRWVKELANDTTSGKVYFNGNVTSYVGTSSVSLGLLANSAYAGDINTVAIGYSALKVNTGVNNLAVGCQAGMKVTSGTGFTLVGLNAGYNQTTGSNTTCLGIDAGYSGAGSSCLFLGAYSGFYETGSFKFMVDYDTRTNEADARVKAMMYGVFASTVASQTLAINAQVTVANLIDSGLTASLPVFTDSNKQLTSTGIGTSAQFIKGDGSLDSLIYLTSLSGALLVTGATVGASSQPQEFTSGYFSTQYTCTTTLNWNNSNVQYIQLANGGQTFTFANPKVGAKYLLILKQPAAGAAGTITWPTVTWQNGSAPTLTTVNGRVDLITFIYDGTNSVYYGSTSLNYY